MLSLYIHPKNFYYFLSTFHCVRSYTQELQLKCLLYMYAPFCWNIWKGCEILSIMGDICKIWWPTVCNSFFHELYWCSEIQTNYRKVVLLTLTIILKVTLKIMVCITFSWLKIPEVPKSHKLKLSNKVGTNLEKR